MKLLTPLLFSLSLFAASAHAFTLVSDDFNRSGPLAGSFASGTGGAWGTGGGNYVTNGTEAGGASTTSAYYFQTVGPLQPNSNYELSVNMSNGEVYAYHWMCFGFGGNATTGDSIRLNGIGSADAYEASNPYASAAGPTFGSFTIKLATDASLSASTISYFRNGGLTQIGSSHTVNVNGFDRVFIADSSDFQGSYDNFLLTGPVPEPSSLLLFSVAGLGLVRRRRC
jgi:PEP-CTERM motif